MTVRVEPDGTIAVGGPPGPGLGVRGARPGLRAGGQEVHLSPAAAAAGAADWDGGALGLRLELAPCAPNGVEIRGRLRAREAGTLNEVRLLVSEAVSLGADPAQVRVMTFARYGGTVAPLAPAAPAAGADGAEPNQAAQPEPGRLGSEDVLVIYDRATRRALLLGFLASERWQGLLGLTVAPDGRVLRLSASFDGGDLELQPGDDLALEPLVVLEGNDPWALLEQYGDLAAKRHGVTCPQTPPVSWCSWYPYRLGVSEERMLAEASVAAARLKPLGLSIIEADLGWERGHLPSAFQPNERFPRGLKGLAGELRRLGFDLGVWKAPFTISAFDPMAAEHPEWLIRGEDGKPLSVWTWFWEPHGDVYVLDLSHPGAQQWLREKIGSLREAGVRYFKADFIGMAADRRAKRRHDRRIVTGGGTEAARLGARLIREALPDALLLNCGGPQLPGTGAWPLLYVCNDTGNTGLISMAFTRENFRALACHLWQNRRWGIIQPSCLCVGLPGTLEEARIRATTAFLAGGQIDISDTLSTLPEDRWAVLEATLPPLGLTAKPLDLFDPVFHRKAADYVALCKGLPTAIEEREHPPGSVWHLRVERGWDAWDLVACFALDQRAGQEAPEMANFTIPLERLGLEPAGAYWGYEFWSGQFLGAVPGGRTNPNGYGHPGDWQDLVTPGPPGTLSLSFTGPAIKLVALRRRRPHPWVVGTSFHQGGGTELEDVRWDAARLVLSGALSRPAGSAGFLVVAGGGWAPLAAEAGGAAAPLLPAAGGAWRLALRSAGPGTSWSIRFAPAGRAPCR